MFFDLEPDSFPSGATFFFNVAIATIAIPPNSDILPPDIMDYWYLGGLWHSRPFAVFIYRDSSARTDGGFDVETYEHCVVELDPWYEVCWYDMIDYATNDPWDLTPTLEDFDYDEDEL